MKFEDIKSTEIDGGATADMEIDLTDYKYMRVVTTHAAESPYTLTIQGSVGDVPWWHFLYGETFHKWFSFGISFWLGWMCCMLFVWWMEQ